MNKISRRRFLPLAGTAILGTTLLSLRDDESNSLETQIIRPKKIGPGSTVGICASAGPVRKVSEVDDFITVLNDKGFKVREGRNARKQYGYFSASDEERAAEFMDMIRDPEVEAIFFTRGGWGCARILEYLDFEEIKRNPKIIMGFSDITTLLNAITAKTGLVTFHGPGGNSTWNAFSWRYIEDLLVNAHRVRYLFPDPEFAPKAPETIVSGEASGILYGGNLSVLSALIGSEYLPDWNGKILFLEDVMEEPYRIDRMLTHLKLSGVFEQINGLVLGAFTKCEPEEPERSFTIAEVFHQHFSTLSIPVFYGAAIGHIKYKFTVPVGMNVTMNADLFSLKNTYSAVI